MARSLLSGAAMRSASLALLAVALGLCVTACTSDDEATDLEAPQGAGGKADGLAEPSLACEATTWLDAVPVAGDAMMAYAGRAYVFAGDGRTWAVVHGETSTTESIPLPEGVVEMRSVRAEIAPSGRPLVTFRSEGVNYAAIFDGNAFVHATRIGDATEAHADADENIYTIDFGGLGLVEYQPGEEPLYRGGLVEDPIAWGVGADGTVHTFLERRRPSTIHRGDQANDLVVRSLPHHSLSWSDEVTVASNEGYGFGSMHFASAQDGSLHVAYGLQYGTYHYRSADGLTWEEGYPSDIVSRANLVDSAGTVFDDDPRDVKGGIVHVAAQDYDHVSITMAYNQGSFSVPGYYHLRSCDPRSGLRETWPADRLSLGGLLAVDERGLATILTHAGARQLAVDDIAPCGDACEPDDAVEPAPDTAIPACAAADVYGPIETAVNLASADGYGTPLVAVAEGVKVNLAGTPYWMDAAFGSAITVPRPDAYAAADLLAGHRSMSGGRTVVFRESGAMFVAANDGVAIEAPCRNASPCDARVAGDGHVWVADPDLHEQAGDDFEDRGGPPVSISAWDVDADGAVWVASTGSRSRAEYMTFWRLAPGALGWSRAGAIPRDVIDGMHAQIEGGFAEGGSLFAADGSFLLFTTARNIGTGQRNRDQYWIHSRDLETWEVEKLPSIEELAGNDAHVGWRYAAFWAATHDRVRYVVMSSDKPIYDGWSWDYPGSRQLNLVERCRTDAGEVVFSTIATVRHPGWTTKGYHAFSRTGVASFLTADGLTQVY